jgi:NADPH:quinone reductase-like Zn-dependent oxidoreductase
MGQPIKFFIANGPYDEQLATLREMIEAGKLGPIIDRTYTLDETAAAIRYLASEQARGKVAIKIAD